jgi:multisubunit Na+/H+ antiporter MnhB subunit
MTAMGVLFILMAAVIALRNLYFIATHFSLESALERYTNSEVTNEKFVVAMIIGGSILIWWGYFKKKEDFGPPDEHERRRFSY